MFLGITVMCRLLWQKLIGPIGEDWIFLTLLGVVMALLSFAMDFIIERCHLGTQNCMFFLKLTT